ncbi:MAG TPA: hypothetical protein VEW90_04970 [Gaiellaceae bacterium]|jgi:hypothetical protein|nr:hypothetical protein [Gaiellaceae bacterium]
MIPWLIVALVVVPLVVAAFVVTRRKSAATPELDDSEVEAQFAAAEAFEAEWHEADEERFHKERLP